MYNTKLNRNQKLFTSAQWQKLLANHAVNADGQDTADCEPVVKLFDPMGAATWLLTECDENGMAFGLCDLGQGMPELGYVYVVEICEIWKNRILGIERDLHFKAKKTLSEYADEANKNQRITA